MPGSRPSWPSESAATGSSGPCRTAPLLAVPLRSLQLGLSGEAVRRYADGWTVAIRDVTPLAHEIRGLVGSGRLDSAARLLPPERAYPMAIEEAQPSARAGRRQPGRGKWQV